MKYFLDTEFIEDGRTIDLISIGIVAEDGREYYAVNKDCDFSKASDWVEEKVLKPMGLARKTGLNFNPQLASPLARNTYLHARKKDSIAIAVVQFMGGEAIISETCLTTPPNYSLDKDIPEPEVWADYAAYDWVVLCQLFGVMMELPKGFPMFIHDIQQECDRLGKPPLPKQKSGCHNALEDAKWIRRSHQFLQEFEAGRRS